jgi:DNA repair exonuclease SbcCD ATPase subunit
MVFEVFSFLLGGFIFGILIYALQSYLTRPNKALHQAELREAKQQLSGVKLEVERVRTQLSDKMGAAGQLETELSELKQRLPKLEGFERANADLRLQMQGFDNIKNKLGNAETELNSLRQKAADFDTLQTKLEAVQTEFSSLKAKTTGFEILQAKAARTDELEGNIAAFELEKANQLKIVSAATLKASDAEAAQLKLKASLNESVAEVARTRAGMQQFEGLKARIDDLEARGVSNETQAKIDGLETELSAYKARVAQLEAANISELDSARDRIRREEQPVAIAPIDVDVMPELPVQEVATTLANITPHEAVHVEPSTLDAIQNKVTEPTTESVQSESGNSESNAS